MAYNGSGSFEYTVTTVAPDAVAGTTIVSNDFDTMTAELKTALGLCLLKDGQQNPSANLPMATYKHTGVGNASASTEYAAWGQVVGKQTLFIPAGSIEPSVTNGCTALLVVELTAGQPNLQVLEFPYHASIDYHGQFIIAFPKSWNLGTITYEWCWSTVATDADSATMALQAVAVADGGPIDVAYGSSVAVTDAAQSAANDELRSAESGAVTIAGTPADGKMVRFDIFRDASGTNTLIEAVRLSGINIFYTTDAATDV